LSLSGRSLSPLSKEAMDSRIVDIYAYQNFRDYLKDFYLERRSKDRKFSIRFFARRAGLRSQNYLKVVMDGRRSLTPRNLPKFIKGLGLVGYQAEYFEALVNLNQARDQVEQRTFLDRLEHLQKIKTAHTLTGDQLDLFSSWYHIAIFEMACQENFQPDPQRISQRLRNRVTPEQVQSSLDLMFRTGILIREGEKINPVASKITSSDQVSLSHSRKLHEAFINFAQESLQNDAIEDREVRSLTVGLTAEQVPLFRAKLREFQREMNTVFSTGKGSEIYQLNLQFFKLTKND
jgi:uncharacterized protein (TIGR02147 family)